MNDPNEIEMSVLQALDMSQSPVAVAYVYLVLADADKQILLPAVYTTLEKLAVDGMVEKSTIPHKNPDRVRFLYRVTATGKLALSTQYLVQDNTGDQEYA